MSKVAQRIRALLMALVSLFEYEESQLFHFQRYLNVTRIDVYSNMRIFNIEMLLRELEALLLPPIGGKKGTKNGLNLLLISVPEVDKYHSTEMMSNDYNYMFGMFSQSPDSDLLQNAVVGAAQVILNMIVVQEYAHVWWLCNLGDNAIGPESAQIAENESLLAAMSAFHAKTKEKSKMLKMLKQGEGTDANPKQVYPSFLNSKALPHPWTRSFSNPEEFFAEAFLWYFYGPSILLFVLNEGEKVELNDVMMRRFGMLPEAASQARAERSEYAMNNMEIGNFISFYTKMQKMRPKPGQKGKHKFSLATVALAKLSGIFIRLAPKY